MVAEHINNNEKYSRERMNTRSIEVMHGYSSIGTKNGTATMSRMVSCLRTTHITSTLTLHRKVSIYLERYGEQLGDVPLTTQELSNREEDQQVEMQSDS